MYRFIVKKEESGRRLDLFTSGKLPNISRSMIKKLILSGNVKVDNKTRFPHYSVKEGENIEVTIPEPEKNILKPFDLKLDVIYEDNDI